MNCIFFEPHSYLVLPDNAKIISGVAINFFRILVVFYIKKRNLVKCLVLGMNSNERPVKKSDRK